MCASNENIEAIQESLDQESIEITRETIHRIGGELNKHKSKLEAHEKLQGYQYNTISDKMQTISDNLLLFSNDIKANYLDKDGIIAVENRVLAAAKDGHRAELKETFKDYNDNLRRTITTHLALLWGSAVIFAALISYIFLSNKTLTDKNIDRMTSDRYTSKTAHYENDLIIARIERLKLKIKGQRKDIAENTASIKEIITTK